MIKTNRKAEIQRVKITLSHQGTSLVTLKGSEVTKGQPEECVDRDQAGSMSRRVWTEGL